jgi:hypothetical protein
VGRVREPHGTRRSPQLPQLDVEAAAARRQAMRRMRTVTVVMSLALTLGAATVLGLVVTQDGRAAQSGPRWTRQFGTAAGDGAGAVALGQDGAVVVVGATDGTLPGQESAGGRDAFVRVYDRAGAEVWTRQFGTGGLDTATAVAVDRTGHIYVVGATDGALPGQTAAGAPDMLADSLDGFVRKYDPTGGELWTRQLGTTNGDVVSAAAVDVLGNLYISGHTADTWPGQARVGGFWDAFLRKYDPDGTELWTRQFGTDGTDSAAGIAIDPTGQVIVVGAANRDTYVRVLDGDGTERWTRQVRGQANDGLGVAVDGDSNIYVVGTTWYVLPSQDAAGQGSAFLRKYNPTGVELWTRQFGTDDTIARKVALDSQRNIYVVGSTQGTIPGQTSTGAFDAFLRKHDPAGQELWTRQFGTDGIDQARSLVLAGDATVYVVGETAGVLPRQAAAGEVDAFLRMYDHDGVTD